MSTFENRKKEIEPKARQEWTGNPELQAEFNGDFESFLAYEVANSLDRFRVQGGQGTQR